MDPHCLPQRLLKHFSRREKQTTFVAIGALRVNTNFELVKEFILVRFISKFDQVCLKISNYVRDSITNYKSKRNSL